MSESSRPRIRLSTKLPIRAILLVVAVLLAGGLIAANLLYAAQARWGLLVDGSPGALLYVSAFTDFADEWDLYDGQQSAALVEEQLELRVTSPQTATWSTARPRFRDFDLSVSATALAGPIDNAYGVVFHARDAADGACDLPALILCGIGDVVPIAGAALRQAFPATGNRGHFAFLISSDGYYSLWKTDAGMAKLLSAWIASPRIKQGLGAANAIRVIARDSSYSFYINGVLAPVCIPYDAGATSTYVSGECVGGAMQDAYYDESNASGKLGVIAQSTATGGGGVVARFDNVLVYSPTEASEEDVQL